MVYLSHYSIEEATMYQAQQHPDLELVEVLDKGAVNQEPEEVINQEVGMRISLVTEASRKVASPAVCNARPMLNCRRTYGR